MTVRLIVAVVGYAGSCLLLLYVAGTLGGAGVVVLALAELAMIVAIWKASAQA
jgi:hypothetical protein